jgi:hypothetical protein
VDHHLAIHQRILAVAVGAIAVLAPRRPGNTGRIPQEVHQATPTGMDAPAPPFAGAWRDSEGRPQHE